MKFGIWIAALVCAVPAFAAPDWTRARIVQVDPEKARVTLQHQRIRSIRMEAMTMPFKVDAAVALNTFKVGDRVRFTVAERDDHLVVDAMEPVR